MLRHPSENDLPLLKVLDTLLLLPGHICHLAQPHHSSQHHVVCLHYCHIASRHRKAVLSYKDWWHTPTEGRSLPVIVTVHFVGPLGIIYWRSWRTYVLPFLFISLFFSLLALWSQNQQMDCLWGCYKQLGYGVILISCDWILRLVPTFWGDKEISQLLPKIWRCHHLPSCRNRTAQHMKTGK